MIEFLAELGISKAALVSYLWSLVPNLLSAGVVILLCVCFYLITAWVMTAAFNRIPLQPALTKIIVRSVYRGVMVIFTIILVLGEFGVNLTATLAGVGVLGLAIGFAAQATISNILAGFAIFMNDIYRKGHWVRVADHYGEVVEISLRNTKLRTLDNTYVSVPNSLVTSSPLINYSEQGMLRITTNVSIAHGESIDQARTILLEAANSIKGVLKRPEAAVVVSELGESAIHLYVRIWVSEPGFEQRYFFLLTEVCKKALDGAGIKIPRPQRDIHVVETPVKRKGVGVKKRPAL